jgi:hypothetical protein
MTTLLAIWGAILSTVLAVWNIYKDIRDRGNVRVEAYLGEWTERDDDTGELLFKYEVETTLTNIGRRPVFVMAVGVGCNSPLLALWRRLPVALRLHRRLPKGFLEAIFEVNGALPKRIDPGEFISIKRENLFFLKSSHGADYNVLFATDSLGKYYFLPKAAWDRMLRNYH